MFSNSQNKPVNNHVLVRGTTERIKDKSEIIPSLIKINIK